MQSRQGAGLGLALLLIIAGIPAIAQQKNAFSAKQCVDYALKNSGQVKNALVDIKIQEQTNREYTAAAYPRLSGSIGTNYFPQVATQVFPNFIAAATYGVLQQEGVKNGSGNSIVSPSDFGFVQAQFGTKYTASAGLEFSQILFDGQVFVGLQARSTALQLAQKSAEVTEVGIRANIFKIYYQLVAARKQVAALDANIAQIEKVLHDTKALFQNGFVEKLDIDKLNVTLTNIQTQKNQVLRQIESGYLGLKMLMGMPMKDDLVLTDSVTEEVLKTDMLEASYNYEDRKEVQQLQLARKLNAYNVKRYELTRIPTVALFGQYSTNAQRNKFNFLDFSQKWFPSSIIGLKVSVPIFEGFGRNARIDKAKLELQKTDNMMDMLKLSVDHDVEQSRIDFTKAMITLENQRKNRELAEKVYMLTTKKYEQGLGSNLEISTAQTELRVAETNYFNAFYDAIIARIDFEKATGKL